MKLKTFNETSLPKQRGGGNKAPRVAFSKSGTITFNPAAAALIGLQSETKVTLAQDEDDDANWYFFIDEKDGFALRLAYDEKGCMMNHRKLVDELVKAFDLDKDVTHNFLIAGQPTMIKGDKNKYWGIIAPVS